jgi:hypothetical protein
VEVAKAVVAVALPGPHVDGALGAKMVPALRDSVVTARLSIDSRVDANTPRPALNVALCIDTSGSMEGKAIEDAKKAALSFLSGIKPGDGFSLVTFDTTAHVVVPATHMTDSTDLASIRAAIGGIRAQGTTAMMEGLSSAIQQVRALYDATRVNRVVLVSDGVPNDPSQLRALAQQAVFEVGDLGLHALNGGGVGRLGGRGSLLDTPGARAGAVPRGAHVLAARACGVLVHHAVGHSFAPRGRQIQVESSGAWAKLRTAAAGVKAMRRIAELHPRR